MEEYLEAQLQYVDTIDTSVINENPLERIRLKVTDAIDGHTVCIIEQKVQRNFLINHKAALKRITRYRQARILRFVTPYDAVGSTTRPGTVIKQCRRKSGIPSSAALYSQLFNFSNELCKLHITATTRKTERHVPYIAAERFQIVYFTSTDKWKVYENWKAIHGELGRADALSLVAFMLLPQGQPTEQELYRWWEPEEERKAWP